MAFAFKRQDKVQKQLRAIAGEQIAKALAEATAEGADFGKTVHGLRRRCKKLRGLLRLIEPGFADFALENRTFREAAAGLSGARDSAVLGQSFAKLLDDGPIDSEVAASVAGHLRSRAGADPDPAAQRQMLDDFCRTMDAAEQRVQHWTVKGRGFAAIEPGLMQTYRAFRDDLEVAEADGTPEALHDWRKQAKYHWHHMSLLQQGAPDVLGPRKELLDTLGTHLGDHHDLAVLDATLDDARRTLGEEAVDSVRAVIANRQKDLAEVAFALGRQLAAPKPATMRAELAGYWHLLDKGH